jgi:hypothetical protein
MILTRKIVDQVLIQKLNKNLALEKLDREQKKEEEEGEEAEEGIMEDKVEVEIKKRT